MSFTLRPFTPADAPAVAAMLCRIDPEPVTAADLIEEADRFPSEGLLLRLVAAGAGGEVLGYGTARHTPWQKPGKFHLFAASDPDRRRQGIGGAIFTAIERFAHANGGDHLLADAHDDAPDDLAFLQRRGYVIDRHLFESTLDLAGFDESRFAGQIEAVKAGGIRFFTLADEPGAATERQYYDLVINTVVDQPGFDNPVHPPFEAWRQRTLTGSAVRPDLILFAADGDRLAGVTRLRWNESTRSMYTQYTGVRPDYRGRGIALALKVLGVGLARQYGAALMRTNNDSQNGPMLAVNRKMGYVSQPGYFFLVRRLGGAEN